MRYQPPSIRELGLKKFLDTSKTKHRGFGYDVFVELYKADLNPSNLCKAFNVTRPTVTNWIDIYNEEKAKATKKPAAIL